MDKRQTPGDKSRITERLRSRYVTGGFLSPVAQIHVILEIDPSRGTLQLERGYPCCRICAAGCDNLAVSSHMMEKDSSTAARFFFFLLFCCLCFSVLRLAEGQAHMFSFGSGAIEGTTV